MKFFFRKIRPFFYWGLPPLIFYLVFKRLDFHRLFDLGKDANFWLIALGVSLIVPKIFAGAYRWFLLTRSYSCTQLTLTQSFGEYWFSLALGVFTPGSLGSDVYRVALGGRQTGLYLQNAFVIGIEKILALFSCAAVITITYPFLTFSNLSTEFENFVDFSYIAFLLSLVMFTLLATIRKGSWLDRLGTTFWQKIIGLTSKALNAASRQAMRDGNPSSGLHNLLRPLFTTKMIPSALALSVIIHVIGAIQGQIYLQAMGYDLPFLANLFIAPLNVLVLTLPITVGGVGVREGASILFYGAFGVPMETALLISFCGFFSVMVGHAIGGIILLVKQRPFTPNKA